VGDQHEFAGAGLPIQSVDSQQILGEPRLCSRRQISAFSLKKILQSTLALVQLVLELTVGFGGRRRIVERVNWRLNGRSKDAVNRVVVLRRNRVKLVIVTTGAGDGEAQ